jgi:cytosine/adenosine deaminase-related metal-dependent hydrolase
MGDARPARRPWVAQPIATREAPRSAARFGSARAAAGAAAERDYCPPVQAGGAPRLAGSAMSQLEMVQRLVRRGVLSIEEALTCASEAPARSVGRWPELGALRAGSFADLVVLDARELALRRALVAGAEIALAKAR